MALRATSFVVGGFSGPTLYPSPGPWSVPFAVPRASFRGPKQEAARAWAALRATWKEAGYRLHPSGIVEFLAE